MEQSALSDLSLKFYVDILRDLALEDSSLMEVVDEMTLGSLMAGLPHKETINDQSLFISGAAGSKKSAQPNLSDKSKPHCVFSDDELLMFGAPVRRHLDISLRKRILEEVRQVLRSITQCYGYTDPVNEDDDLDIAGLPSKIQGLKDEIENKTETVASASRRVAELIAQITKSQKDLDERLRHAVSVTFPVHDAVRTASIELLATTIEASLVKLSLARARANRALYSHTLGKGVFKSRQDRNVGKALEAAYISLKKDEKDMMSQSHSLDRQLWEYDSLMQLVDDGKGGYRQVIDEWTQVKQETDECLKDLRRLGWTGDW